MWDKDKEVDRLSLFYILESRKANTFFKIKKNWKANVYYLATRILSYVVFLLHTAELSAYSVLAIYTWAM